MKPPVGPDARGSRCGLGKGGETVLVAAQGGDLVFVRDDGSSFVAASFPTQEGSSTIQLAAAGNFVAAIGYTWGTPEGHGRAVLLDRDGHVLFSEEPSDGGVDAVFVSERGDAAFGDALGRTILAHADGSHETVEGVVALGPPDASGRFAAYRAPTENPPVYGWAAAGQDLALLQFPGSASYPAVAGDELVYVGERDGATVLVREGAGVPKTFPFQDANATVNDAAADGWVMLSVGLKGKGFVAAPDGGARKVTLPTGLAPFGMATYRGLRLGGGDAGEVLFVGRDASHGGLFGTTDRGATWTPIGPSFSKITSLESTSRAGTYVVVATDEPGYFEMKAWSEPSSPSHAPDHVGPAVFVVRPADGIQQRIHLRSAFDTHVDLDAAGRCAAFVGKDNGLRGHDVKTGREKVLVSAAVDGSGATAFAWLR